MATLSIGELMARIEARDLAPVLLFGPGKPPFGKEPFEPYLAEQAIERIIKAYVDPSLQDLVYSSHHADETAPGQIANEAETLPFLAERRVIIVRNADRYNLMSGEKTSPFAPLARYIENPSDTTLLVFIATKPDQRKKFYKACKKGGDIVECPQLSDPEIEAWIRTRASEKGKQIGRAAVAELVARTGSALSEINNAVDVVATYVGDAPAIEAADVVAACADVSEDTVWDLTDAIAASNPDKALHALYQLIDLGNQPDQIMGVINWMLENAYRSAPETQAQVKSKFVQQKMMPLVEKLGVAKLRQACTMCTDTNFMVRNTGVDKVLALELLVVKLSARRRGKPARH